MGVHTTLVPLGAASDRVTYCLLFGWSRAAIIQRTCLKGATSESKDKQAFRRERDGWGGGVGGEGRGLTGGGGWGHSVD